MACNRDSPADGATSPVPTPPAAATPASCPSPDVLVPCRNGNCHFSGCSPASMNLCPNCSATEHFGDDENASSACKQMIDLAADQPCAAYADEARACDITQRSPSPTEDDRKDCVVGTASTPAVADISELRMVMKSSGSTSSCKIQANQPSVSRTGQMQRIPSSLSLSPPLQEEARQSLLPPPMAPRKQAVNRCAACCKRVGLVGFKCRCGDLFCASHRYSDEHDCSYDYKAAGRLAIAKENPVVKASKISKI